MKKNIQYMAPEVEIIEVAVEKGFASSEDYENVGVGGEGYPDWWGRDSTNLIGTEGCKVEKEEALCPSVSSFHYLNQ